MPRRQPIIPCELSNDVRTRIEAYTASLRKNAAKVGTHGLSEEEFWEAGIFHAAVEKLRGTQAAFIETKRKFIDTVLHFMQQQGEISGWEFVGGGERHDYEITMRGGRLCVIEAKGCLDGNNTNIFERPPNADEFLIWSLCQNPGSDPQHNAWSGIHTRLSAEIIHRRQRVDGLIIWDMLCATHGRPCPKLQINPRRSTQLGKKSVPPPCVYLFPRTLPDPRNNPHPTPWRLKDVRFLDALMRCFKGEPSDAVHVSIETRMHAASVERRTAYSRDGVDFATSDWTAVRRAR